MDPAQKNDEDMLKSWFRLIDLPYLLSKPFDPLVGFFFLIGTLDFLGWQGVLHRLFAVCVAALLLHIFNSASKYLTLESAGNISRKTTLTVIILSGLLALLFASVSFYPLIICAGILLLSILCNFVLKFADYVLINATLTALSRILNIALGMTLLILNQTEDLMAGLLLFAVFFYVLGVEIVKITSLHAMEKRPGGKLFLFGSVLAYLTLFGTVIMHKLDSIPMLVSGFMSAVAAALFLILTYKAYKLFQSKTSVQQTHSWVDILTHNIIFLQIAAVSARGWYVPGLVLGLIAGLAVYIFVKGYGSSNHGK